MNFVDASSQPKNFKDESRISANASLLQSMAEVERDPHFRSKKYVIVDKEELVDPASGAIPVVLKHPDNVIVVASLTGKSPPPVVGKTRVTMLSTALLMASVFSWHGSSGCSIVVHGGMYIDFSPEAAKDFRNVFSLEIIGTE